MFFLNSSVFKKYCLESLVQLMAIKDLDKIFTLSCRRVFCALWLWCFVCFCSKRGDYIKMDSKGRWVEGCGWEN